MVRAGVDVADPAQVAEFYLAARDAFIARVERIVHAHNPEATLVHNHTTDAWLGRTIGPQNQIDVESLPTDGAWGYLHFPVLARYARAFDRPVVGMTGRFHRSWSDFGGLKTPDQMSYEVATILSAGASPSIGDHLDPSGRLDPAVYAAIGHAYSRAHAIEEWTAGATPLAEAAVLAGWAPVDADAGRVLQAPTPGVHGAAQTLLEHAVQFDIVDSARLVPGRHRLVIVPDDVPLGPDDIVAIERCRQAGAALLTCGAAPPPNLPGAPVVSSRPLATRPSFFRAGGLAGAGLDPDFAYACYGRGHAIVPTEGAEALGEVADSRFDRTWRRFTSHGHSPVGPAAAGPLAAVADGWAHLAAPVFSDYHREGYWPASALVGALLDRLVPDRLVRHDGPAWVEVTLHEAPAAGATVLHATAYQPRRAAGPVPRIDTGHPIAGFALRVRTGKPVVRAVIVPEMTPVRWEEEADGAVRLSPETLAPHTVIALVHAVDAAAGPGPAASIS
jgi:hypothetical protein